MKHKVLWIDDVPNQDFIDAALEDYDIQLINYDNYADGIKWLKENREICSAVLLDVNCKGNKNEAASKNTSWDVYFAEVTKVCDQEDKPLIPWFVYTAGDCEGIEDLDAQIKIFRRIWDESGKTHYKKPADRKVLFENINKAIDVFPVLKHAKKYKDIFSAFSNKENLMSLLRIFDVIEDNYINNSNIYNDIRKILESISDKLKERGFFPEDQNGLSSASYYIKTICIKSNQLLVPSYISYCFTACEHICNDGSHNGGKTPLRVDKDTSENRAPYLIRSAFYMLCSIVAWLNSLSEALEDVALLKQQISNLNISPYRSSRN